ncbi:unnamed protein product [Orchesella dallaii]|uniref:Uncharacterized protein n=1 Tax=Orchesella dallaii TaxID=48710 RepID=A0ABP1R4Y8_9HEXA
MSGKPTFSFQDTTLIRPDFEIKNQWINLRSSRLIAQVFVGCIFVILLINYSLTSMREKPTFSCQDPTFIRADFEIKNEWIVLRLRKSAQHVFLPFWLSITV